MTAIGLFMVMYVLGIETGSVGPLPYNWHACRVLIVQSVYLGAALPTEHVQFACEYRVRRKR